jgi:hypothetical protein
VIVKVDTTIIIDRPDRACYKSKVDGRRHSHLLSFGIRSVLSLYLYAADDWQVRNDSTDLLVLPPSPRQSFGSLFQLHRR